MSTTLSIQDAQRRSIKQTTRDTLGLIVSALDKQRSAQLLSHPISQPSEARDRLIMSHLKRRAMLAGQEDFFERLHADFWQGEGGAVFSQNCDHRFNELFLEKQLPDFRELQALWNDSPVRNIVEFGCNSGLLLEYLTSELTGVNSATGIEINAEQVGRNQTNPRFDQRIQFVHADGAKWLLENAVAKTLYVSNGGVLEYFRRDSLDAMLTHIAKQLPPALFFCIEPVAADHDWSQTKHSIPFGEELSFSHNYTDLFESNGFEITHQRAVQYDSWTMMATVARTG